MDYLTLKLLEAEDPRGLLAAEKWVLTMSEDELNRLRSIVENPPAAWRSDPEMDKAVKSLLKLLRTLGKL